MKPERRYIKSEVRLTDGDSPKIIGHGAVFGRRSLDLGGFVEVIAPGAFDACLAASPDIVGLWNHDQDQLPLGRTTSGTMTVEVDDVGLRYAIEPSETTICKDLLISLRRKDVNASSFGFFCLEDTWDLDRDTDTLVRTVLKAEVFDCSPVTFPAYPDADAGLRALMQSAMRSNGEIRCFGVADVEIRSKIANIRQQLIQGDHAAIDYWSPLMALELAEADMI